eukprot:Nk52_evm4s355 gene=Nk52_evmTU4s355
MDPNRVGKMVDLSRFTILIVDDSRPNRQVLEMILKKVFQVNAERIYSCENGLEAVEAYEREKPDIIFMDCNMPVMDGYEATRKIREIEHRELAKLQKEQEQTLGCEDDTATDDGWERSCEQDKQSLIIAVTADATNNPKASLESGMDEAILKPFSAVKFLHSVQACHRLSKAVALP